MLINYLLVGRISLFQAQPRHLSPSQNINRNAFSDIRATIIFLGLIIRPREPKSSLNTSNCIRATCLTIFEMFEISTLVITNMSNMLLSFRVELPAMQILCIAGLCETSDKICFTSSILGVQYYSPLESTIKSGYLHFCKETFIICISHIMHTLDPIFRDIPMTVI